MPKAKILSPDEAALIQTLDTTTLGRPFHLLPLLMHLIEDRMREFISRELGQRFRADFTLLSLDHSRQVQTHARWTWHRVGEATLGVHIERPLLLRILDCRYGGRTARPGTEAQEEESPAETETEYRLARLLGERLAPQLPEFIDQLAGETRETPLPLRTLGNAPNTAPAWQLMLTLGERGTTLSGKVSLCLDRDSLDRLLRAVTRHAPQATGRNSTGSTAFSDTLRIRLKARLMEKRTTLAEVLALQVGQVIGAGHPGRADIHIGSSRLFTASVVECDGKLGLTSFEDAE